MGVRAPWLFRLGFIADLLSRPVLIGFLAGSPCWALAAVQTADGADGPVRWFVLNAEADVEVRARPSVGEKLIFPTLPSAVDAYKQWLSSAS